MELQSGIGVVLPFGTLEERDAYIRVIEETAGIKPAARRDDVKVKRALYAPAKTRAILNCSAREVLDALGLPSAVITLEVEDPAKAAKIAKRILRSAKYSPDIVDCGEVELGIPKGFMFFVVPGACCVPILFWPKNPKPEDLAKITPPQPWGE